MNPVQGLSMQRYMGVPGDATINANLQRIRGKHSHRGYQGHQGTWYRVLEAMPSRPDYLGTSGNS